MDNPIDVNLFSRYLRNYPGTVVSTILFATAFCVFSANAILYQPNSHPVPIWKSSKSGQQPHALITGSTPIPYRRVETVSFRPDNIAVPTIRPSAQNFSAPATSSEIVAANKNSSKSGLASIQKHLILLGHYDGEIDGVDGPMTRKAVTEYQKSRSLSPTGKLTNSQFNQLTSVSNTKGLTKTIVASLKNRDTVLSNPADTKLVTRVQIGLINFGERSIKIDGVMGNNTANAIRKFQQRFKLDITGKPSQELVEKLEKVGALTRG